MSGASQRFILRVYFDGRRTYQTIAIERTTTAADLRSRVAKKLLLGEDKSRCYVIVMLTRRRPRGDRCGNSAAFRRRRARPGSGAGEQGTGGGENNVAQGGDEKVSAERAIRSPWSARNPRSQRNRLRQHGTANAGTTRSCST